MARWLESLPKPVGVMACNDDIGVQILEACKLAGLTVPDDIGVIGADNDEVVCGLADPAMSSVAVNFERAGYESAQALDHLMRRLHGVPAQIKVQATHIVVRRSTDVVAVADEAVARAMRFIRDHTRGPVAVSAVAKAAGLSRRVQAVPHHLQLDLAGAALPPGVQFLHPDGNPPGAHRPDRPTAGGDAHAGEGHRRVPGLSRHAALRPLFSRGQAGQPAGVPAAIGSSFIGQCLAAKWRFFFAKWCCVRGSVHIISAPIIHL